jgi:hypothetical protein
VSPQVQSIQGEWHFIRDLWEVMVLHPLGTRESIRLGFGERRKGKKRYMCMLKNSKGRDLAACDD